MLVFWWIGCCDWRSSRWRKKKAVKAKSRGVGGERWKERGCTLKRTSVSRGLQVVAPGRKRREKGTHRKCCVVEWKRWRKSKGSRKSCMRYAQFDYRLSFVPSSNNERKLGENSLYISSKHSISLFRETNSPVQNEKEIENV